MEFYPKTAALLACTLALFAVSGNSNSFGSVPIQVFVEATKAYRSCGSANQRGSFEAADEACKNGLKLLAPYEDRLQIGLYLLQANVKQNKKDFTSAEDLAQKAVSLAIKLEGKNSPFYAAAVAKKAEPYFTQGKYQLAKALFAEAVDTFEVLFERERTQNGSTIAQNYRSEYVRSIDGLLYCQIAEDNDKAALVTAKKILEAARKVPNEYELHLALASGCSQFGEGLYKDGETKHARRLFEKSIELYNKYRDENPAIPIGAQQDTVPFPSIISAMHYLGEIYEKSGRVAEGKKLQQEARQWQSVRDTLSKR